MNPSIRSRVLLVAMAFIGLWAALGLWAFTSEANAEGAHNQVSQEDHDGHGYGGEKDVSDAATGNRPLPDRPMIETLPVFDTRAPETAVGRRRDYPVLDTGRDTGRKVAIAVIIMSLVALLLTLFWPVQDGGQAQNRSDAEAGAEANERDGAPTLPADRQQKEFGLASGTEQKISGPMLLTVPALGHLDDSRVPTAPGADNEALDQNAGVHMQGTGYPWQGGSNVYISGHRMGFPGTPSFRAFYKLDELENGDRVILTDAGGTDYVYRVYETLEVGPDEVDVTLPVAGKSIVSLQTCTLPNYTKRIVVRAELEP